MCEARGATRAGVTFATRAGVTFAKAKCRYIYTVIADGRPRITGRTARRRAARVLLLAFFLREYSNFLTR